MTFANHLLAAALTTLAFGAQLACKKGEDGMAHMPPAAGPGATPRSELPKLDLVDTSDDGVVAGGTGETTGTTFPRQEAYIGPKVTGTIAAVLVDEGSRVKKGDVLFRLDSSDMRLRVDQAMAALKSAQVGESATKVEFDRFQRLFEQKAVDQAQWDGVRARYDGALAGVGQARVAVDMANKALADTTVRSPMDGVVTAKMKSVGEMATTMPPTPVVAVQDQSVLELRFPVPEKDLVRYHAGQEIFARFDALGVTHKATIARINPTVDFRSRTVTVVAEIPNAEFALRPGLLAAISTEEPGAGGAGDDHGREAAKASPGGAP